MRILLGAVLVLVVSAGLLGCESDCQEAARLQCKDKEVWWAPGGNDDTDRPEERCYAERLFICARGQ